MTRPRCGARVTLSESQNPSIQIGTRGLMFGPPDVRWWCDVAHAHLTKDEAIECNRATVLVNPLHASHGHGGWADRCSCGEPWSHRGPHSEAKS